MAPKPDPILAIENLAIDVGGKHSRTRVLQGLDLNADKGESVTVIGVSGSGKTTLLSAIAGYLHPASGQITFRGRAVTGPSPARTMIFQRSTLFAWLTVSQNLRFSAAMRNLPHQERRQREQLLLENTGVPGTENLYPSQLSVGMAERVEIARALANLPELLLIDEPFSAVDAFTRDSIRYWFGQLARAWELTVVMVNHDITEALLMSDRIAVLRSRPGSIQMTIPVPFSWPREPELVGTHEFQLLRQSVLSELEIDFRARVPARQTKQEKSDLI